VSLSGRDVLPGSLSQGDGARLLDEQCSIEEDACWMSCIVDFLTVGDL
jgi:hypothetical protein